MKAEAFHARKTAIAAEIANAGWRLSQAQLSGENTAPLHRRLAELGAKDDEVTGEFADWLEERNRLLAKRHDEIVEAETERQVEAVKVWLASLADRVAGAAGNNEEHESMMTMLNISPAVIAAAKAVASALQNSACADQAFMEATEHRAVAQGRIDALEAERAAITAARQRGDRNDALQGPRLALIAADLDGLGELLRQADEATNSASRVSAEASASLKAAQQQLDFARDVEGLAIAEAHAGKLATALAATLVEMAAISTRTGRSLNWAPTRELANTIRRIDLQRGGA
jgi:hypothetical protein